MLIDKYLLSGVPRDAAGEGAAGGVGASDDIKTLASAGGAAGGAAAGGGSAGAEAGAAGAAAGGAAGGAAKPGEAAAGAAAAAAKPTWPEDWRNQVAGDDKKLLEQLARYSDPLAAIKKGFEFEKRLSAGELKSQLPANATPEQVKAWRTENGIPTEDKAYLENMQLPNGLVLGEAERPNAEAFAKVANELGLDKKAYDRIIAFTYQHDDRDRALRAEADAAFAKTSDDKLRDAWKTTADYNRNINAVSNLMAQMPESLVDEFRLARMPNGNIVGNDPAVMQFLAKVALDLDPAAPLLPAGSTGGAKGVETRLAEIRKFRTENPQGYDGDKKMQAEEIELLDAQLRMNKRRA